MKFLKVFVILLVFPPAIKCFSQQKNLAERLGYPKDAKLLIIHADDAGLSHSEDSATITAFEKGPINSASIMVPCPWFPEIAAYAKQHPELDWGIHTTFTAEWKNYKWDGVLPSNEISSLLDKDGYMYTSNQEFAKNAKAADVEKEIRAEIERCAAFGIKITHIDNHMGSILASPELITVYQQIGKAYRLPVLIPMNLIRMMAPQMEKYIDTNTVIVDNYISAYPRITADHWKQFYDENIKNLRPGLNVLVFHLAYDNDEMRAITTGHPDFDAAWRQRDIDYVTSDAFKTLLKQSNVQLVTWAQIQKLVYNE